VSGDDFHDCPIDRCVQRVPHHQLMCRRHWRMVPAADATAVYGTWRNGRGAGSEEHIEAMNMAIAAVERKVSER
jgi:hypothetical protein